MFERFTDRARRALILAQEEAVRANYPFIGTEVILLGILGLEESIAKTTLNELGITLDLAREQMAKILNLGDDSSPFTSPPFTPGAKKSLELSLREALQLGHNYIGPEHMLLGLMREGEGVACKIIFELGVDPTAVREKLLAKICTYKPDPRPKSSYSLELGAGDMEKLKDWLNGIGPLEENHPAIPLLRAIERAT